MKKYSDVFDMVANEVRDRRVWPVNALTSEKLNDQIRYVFGSLLVVARELPFKFLGSQLKLESLTLESDGPMFSASLPPIEDDSLFLNRPDFGIESFVFDNRRYPFATMSDFETVQLAASSYLHGSSVLFHVDPELLKVFVTMKPTSAKVHYVPMFVQPTVSNDALDDKDFPLPSPYDEQVAQLAAMHVDSILTGDRGVASVRSALAAFYGGAVGAERGAAEVDVDSRQ